MNTAIVLAGGSGRVNYKIAKYEKIRNICSDSSFSRSCFQLFG